VIPVYDHVDSVRTFVSKGLWDGKRQFGSSTAIGFANADQGLVAGVVYHNFEPDAGVIEVSAYSARRDWLSRDLLRVIFEYPFFEIGCRLVVARISEHNTRTLRIWNALGSKQYSIPELRGPNEAEVIATLTRDDWQNSKFMR
jgi:RimJ/RimL family protein N-acetyltransferase